MLLIHGTWKNNYVKSLHLDTTLTLQQNHKTESSNLDHPQKPCSLFPSKPSQTVGLK